MNKTRINLEDWIKYNDSIVQVKEINEVGDTTLLRVDRNDSSLIDDIEKFSLIPINEENLKALGFKETTSGIYVKDLPFKCKMEYNYTTKELCTFTGEKLNSLNRCLFINDFQHLGLTIQGQDLLKS